MVTRQVVIDVSEKIMLEKKTDEIWFSRELRALADEKRKCKTPIRFLP